MIPVTIKSVKLLFNQKAILTPAEKFQVKLLGQMGALTRTITRRSIRPATSKRQRSQPGQPPVSHSGPINYRDTIFFVVDAKKKEMVCGGVLLSGTAARGQAVPGTLEHGGVMIRASGKLGRYQQKPLNIQARPHTGPAFAKAVKMKLPDLIAGGIMREV